MNEPRRAPPPPVIPSWCDVAGCPRDPGTNPSAKPFDSPAAVGSHKRRRHGIVSLARRLRRPPGGQHYCPEPGCTESPYFTSGGLGTHRRNAHGWQSEAEDSVARRERRAKARRRIKRRKKIKDPPPPSPATTTHVPTHSRTTLSITQKTWLRLRLLYVVNGTWAREMDAAPIALRDEILRLAGSNFAMAKPDRRVER